ncbi:MAG: NAD-dependent epimerase/dehydratase family protein [Planctomycetota bacterium]|jgi:UDP-glucose 4-epimerase
MPCLEIPCPYVEVTRNVKVLITGSSGQIGTNLAEKLAAKGHAPIGLDIRGNPWIDSFETVVADLTAPDPAVFDRLAARSLDCIVHLAAHAKVYELVENPRKARENVDMLFNALELARIAGVPFIFGSSREVYGDIMRTTTGEHHADFVVAESPYSASKIAGEAFVYSYGRCYDLGHLVFRFSNVYGRYDNDLDRLERVVPLFINKIASGLPITIYGPEKVLDFTYIDDCVAGLAAGIERLVAGSVSDETFNLAYGKGYSLRELVDIIAGALGVQPEVSLEPTRPGEVTRYVADISKAGELLDYSPATPLEKGVPREIEWARNWRPPEAS